MDERKGVLTKEQEKILDELLKFNNKIAESVDGLAISLIDNQLLERLQEMAEKKFPGVSEEFIFPIVDAIVAGLQQIVASQED